MSEPTRDVDLRSLSRSATTPPPAPARGRRMLWIPILVVTVLIAALAKPLVEAFAPRVSVRIVRPVRHDGATSERAGTPILSTSGFVEPDPTPMRISALVPGIVREVLVQAGDTIERDQVVARLIDDDARIARDRASAASKAAVAEHAVARAEAAAARDAFEANLEWTAALASAAADVKVAHANAIAAIADVSSATARCAAAEAELEIDRALVKDGGTGSIELRIAEAEAEEARAAFKAADARANAATAAIERIQAEFHRVGRAAELRIADIEKVATSQANLARAEAAVAIARSELAAAELALARTEVRALDGGIVFERKVAPGDRVGEPESPAIVTAFHPDRIRVRADVPLQNAFQVSVGMQARITLDGTDLALDAVVVRHVPFSDLTKSTIPIHVKAPTADARLVPDLLVRVQFFGGGDAGASASPSTAAVVIPRSALRDGGIVFVVDADDRARPRTVTTAPAADERSILVTAGLTVGDRVIATPPASLIDGDRIRIDDGAP